jgi:hypothetical protein
VKAKPCEAPLCLENSLTHLGALTDPATVMTARFPNTLLVTALLLGAVACGENAGPEGGGGSGGKPSSGAAGAANGGTAVGGSSTPTAGSSTGGTSTGGTSTGGTSTGGTSTGGSGGSPDNGNFPPLQPMDDVRKLSAGDKGLLCDWVNETLGGYALSTNCGPSSVRNDDTQAQCVATRYTFNCKVTVQELKDCTLATAPSHGCSTDFPECHPLSCVE